MPFSLSLGELCLELAFELIFDFADVNVVLLPDGWKRVTLWIVILSLKTGYSCLMLVTPFTGTVIGSGN